jgi:hypothetical protein
MTDQALIQSLCDDLTPVRPRIVEKQIALALTLGGAVSLVALASTLGIQPGLDTIAGGIPFAMKLGFALPLAALAFGAAKTLARPGNKPASLLIGVSTVTALLAVIAMAQFALAPHAQAAHVALGASWHSCSLRIAALSLPLMAGFGWAMRKQAPVRLREAGAAVGLASGAGAAAIYALACTEASASFVLIWYSLGIALATALGAALGPRLLRW